MTHPSGKQLILSTQSPRRGGQNWFLKSIVENEKSSDGGRIRGKNKKFKGMERNNEKERDRERKFFGEFLKQKRQRATLGTFISEKVVLPCNNIYRMKCNSRTSRNT